MNIHEIYGILFSGKTIQLHFASEAEADSFRVGLHRYKKGQEQVLIAADLMESHEVSTLSFKLQGEMKEVTGSLLTATISFKSKRILKSYEIVILETEEESEESRDE